MMTSEPWSSSLEMLEQGLNRFDAFSIEVLKKQQARASAVHKPVR